MRKILLFVGACVGMGPSAIAQGTGAIEAGIFGRYTIYDKSFSATNSHEHGFGGGIRLGYFFMPRLSVEADASYNKTDLENYFIGVSSSPIRYMPIHLRALYHHPLGSRFGLLAGVGPVMNHYGRSSSSVTTIFGTDFGVGGLAGFRVRLNRFLTVRADATLDYMPEPANGKSKVRSQGVEPTVDEPSDNMHFGIQLGLSYLVGGACKDRLDTLNLTPATASVDSGQSVKFTVTGVLCDGTTTVPEVLYSTTGDAKISPTGEFTATKPGAYQVFVRTPNGKLADTANVTIKSPPPPPPTLSDCTLSPDSATVKAKEPVEFTIDCIMSDSSKHDVVAADLKLTGTGDPTIDGNKVSWAKPGEYLVESSYNGMIDTAKVKVTPLEITLRALFEENRYSEAYKLEEMSLDEVADTMKADTTMRVYVDGHTDWRNSIKYNAWLSKKRAEYIKQQLVDRGVDAKRIVVRAFGECNPLEQNDSDEGMATNRRVVVHQIMEDLEPANASCKEAGPPGPSKIGRKG